MPNELSKRERRERRLSSWPRPLARIIPTWVPFRILQAAETVAIYIALPFVHGFLIYTALFCNTDLWGVPRDRAEERRWTRKWKQYRKEEAHWKPPALPQQRPRRLSLPLEAVTPVRRWWMREKPQQAFDQRQSPLGRLPEELRLAIYRHLVAGKRLHIQESYQRMGYVGCKYNDTPEDTAVCNIVLECLQSQLDKSRRIGQMSPPSTGSRLILSSYDHLKLKPESVHESNEPVPQNDLLALAKTCRLLYVPSFIVYPASSYQT